DTPSAFGRADQSLKDVEIVLTSRITQVNGTVRDSSGRAAGTDIVAFSPDRDQWYPSSRYLTRSSVRDDGTFAIPGLPPGEFLVAALGRHAAAGEEDEWQDPDFLESLRSRATRILLEEGQTAALTLSAPPR